jgi:hypothetical protein
VVVLPENSGLEFPVTRAEPYLEFGLATSEGWHGLSPIKTGGRVPARQLATARCWFEPVPVRDRRELQPVMMDYDVMSVLPFASIVLEAKALLRNREGSAVGRPSSADAHARRVLDAFFRLHREVADDLPQLRVAAELRRMADRLEAEVGHTDDDGDPEPFTGILARHKETV